MAQVTMQITDEQHSWRQIQLLRRFLHSPKLRVTINEEILKALTPYVPMKSGELRDSAVVNEEGITWGVKGAQSYARYMYRGVVYGPNLPGWIDGVPGFRSPKVKHVTHVMGMPDTSTLDPVFVLNNGKYRRANKNDPSFSWIFGYTTVNTQSRWDLKYKGEVKYQANQEITRKLRRMLKAEGHLGI